MRSLILSKKLGKKFPKKQISQLAKQTKGLSAAFVQEVAIKALRNSFLKGKPITIQDLTEALKKVQRQVSDSSVGWTGRIGFS
jgi:AAA+ superfamily predicted ATPase